MINIFRKKKEKQAIASISYSVFEDSNDVIIDIKMEDYQDNSVNGICNILKTLSQETCIVQTINMVKDGLLDDNQKEILLKILNYIGTDIILQNTRHNDLNQPCIMPSEML